MTKIPTFKKSEKNADAELTTNIVMYGISIPHGFSTDYVPVLSINSKLTYKNQVVWQDSSMVLPLSSGLPHHQYKEMISDPAILTKMWNVAAEKSVHDLVADITKVNQVKS